MKKRIATTRAIRLHAAGLPMAGRLAVGLNAPVFRRLFLDVTRRSIVSGFTLETVVTIVAATASVVAPVVRGSRFS